MGRVLGDESHKTCGTFGSGSDGDGAVACAATNIMDETDELREAAKRDYLHQVKTLLARGASVRSNEYANTSMHSAAQIGDLAAVKVMLKGGARVNREDEQRRTALHGAALNGHLDIVEVLLSRGANVNRQDKHGVTPLHVAEDVAVVEALLARRARINSIDDNGETALHRAAARGVLDVVRALLARGATISSKDKWGKTALHFAANEAVVEALVASGADVHCVDEQGDTPLHRAARCDKQSAALALLRAGADPLKQNKEGETPQSLLPTLMDAAKTIRRAHTPEEQPLPLLQNALKSVLQRSAAASTQCTTLINEHNCSQSIAEWNAAHSLLVLAVRGGEVQPVDVGGKLYYWKDQLYSTVSDLCIESDEDKQLIFKCLREAHELQLIDSADAYINGMRIMNVVRSQVFALKKAGLMLLERVLCLEASVEDLGTSVQDLRTAFESYRKRQLFSDVVGIAISLIPVAGGAVAKAFVVGGEVFAELSAADVIEYSLSAAAILLDEQNFSSLPESRQRQISSIFDEYGYSSQDVQNMLRDRSIGCSSLKSSEEEESEEQSDQVRSEQAEQTDQIAQTALDDSNIAPQTVSDRVSSSAGDQNNSSMPQQAASEHSNGESCSVASEHQASNADDHTAFSVPEQTASTDNVGERDSVASDTQTSSTDRQSTVSVPHVSSDQDDHQQKRSLHRQSSRQQIVEFANSWTVFILGSRNDDHQLHTRLSKCLVKFLEDASVLPQSLKFATPSQISELKEVAAEVIKRELGSKMRLGYGPKSNQFLDQYVQTE